MLSCFAPARRSCTPTLAQGANSSKPDKKPPPAPAAAMGFCDKCGEIIRGGASCPRCGGVAAEALSSGFNEGQKADPTIMSTVLHRAAGSASAHGSNADLTIVKTHLSPASTPPIVRKPSPAPPGETSSAASSAHASPIVVRKSVPVPPSPAPAIPTKPLVLPPKPVVAAPAKPTAPKPPVAPPTAPKPEIVRANRSGTDESAVSHETVAPNAVRALFGGSTTPAEPSIAPKPHVTPPTAPKPPAVRADRSGNDESAVSHDTVAPNAVRALFGGTTPPVARKPAPPTHAHGSTIGDADSNVVYEHVSPKAARAVFGGNSVPVWAARPAGTPPAAPRPPKPLGPPHVRAAPPAPAPPAAPAAPPAPPMAPRPPHPAPKPAVPAARPPLAPKPHPSPASAAAGAPPLPAREEPKPALPAREEPKPPLPAREEPKTIRCAMCYAELDPDKAKRERGSTDAYCQSCWNVRPVPEKEIDVPTGFGAARGMLNYQTGAGDRVPLKIPNFNMQFDMCDKCNTPILTTIISTPDGRKWCEDCWVCAKCGLPIASTQFAMEDGEPIHPTCAKRDACPRCGMPIDGAYVQVGGKPVHSHCFTCARCGNELAGKSFAKLGDDEVCSSCLRSQPRH
ncbi:hypothetical protein AMAG_10467 [Allomyces macrogynus ATCC 38327]|uniref:LIM zinc-binding domain-containing protein n=1 Tax=Allomyces macrogynus (strain ATCC 38327) TaxID=578462 RepID=A0A0L0SV60_ALLM3|nr:hypothetical protein AMAG_10467 [Allomyces macrogynus ATCC 38327]|eukprot:KNE66229.1 hypothetical protein AMAG_10467 [Allomyces macrogynus ATCC 38327]